MKIKRALLSVSNKDGIVDLGRKLQEIDCEIITTGGTKKVLEDAGIKCTDISLVTGNPEAFGGRMKTISFNIESALLYHRDRDKTEAEALGIKPIDLVVCNLYPFAEVKKSGADFETLIEHIDIGGPTMVRASAKNFQFVATVTDPTDYEAIIKQLDDNDGAIDYQMRKELMRKAFNHTADYDSLIAETMDADAEIISKRMHFSEGRVLRYGENSHQKGYLLKDMSSKASFFDMEILHGKEISFNNMVDIQGAVDAVKDLENHGVAVVKHTNACGLAQSESQKDALAMAWAGDPISAFGSIVAFNTPVSLDTVDFFQLNNENKMLRKFVEVVIAPDFSADALEYLQFHKNLRIIKYDPNLVRNDFDYKFLHGSLLIQDQDNQLYSKMDVKCGDATGLKSKEDLIKFGIISMKQIKSNSIVIVRALENGFQLLGMGAGQPNRLVSTRLAVEKCRENLARDYVGDDFDSYFRDELSKCILVSDAFFPFPDNVELAAEAGIKTIIQPGGSMRDKRVIKVAEQLGMTVIFTGLRHFKH